MDYVYNVILQIVPESTVVQEYVSINIESQARNVQIPSTMIDAIWEDLNTSLQQLQNIALDIKRLFTQTLVSMQQVSNQELANREKDINDQYLWSQEEEEVVQKEVEELHCAKEILKADKA